MGCSVGVASAIAELSGGGAPRSKDGLSRPGDLSKPMAATHWWGRRLLDRCPHRTGLQCLAWRFPSTRADRRARSVPGLRRHDLRRVWNGQHQADPPELAAALSECYVYAVTRSATTRVVLVDPHPLYRFALGHICAGDDNVDVVGAYETAAAGLAAIRELSPDVAVVEFDFADGRCPTLIRSCQAESPSTRVLVLTARWDGADVYESIAAGATGYVVKSADQALILTAISSVARGETLLDPTLHRSVAAEIRLHAARAEVDLTPREREVLALVAEGCSSREIGQRLYVSETTIKTHLANLYEKLGVSSRAAAVAQAMKRGLVEAA